MISKWRKYWWPWAGFVIALTLHLWRLGLPAGIVSDETFFVHDGHAYITQQPYFDPHPPLGKLQLGAVFAVAGYRPVTWRIINAVEGALLIPLVWWLAWRLTRRRVAAALVVGLLLLDGLTLVDSRLGMINIPYILYALAALASIFKALDSPRPGKWLLMTGLMIGAALATKWLAILIILPALVLWFWPQAFGQQRHTKQPPGTSWASLGCLVVLPMFIYWLVFVGHFAWLGQPDTFWATNTKMLNYHLSVPSRGDPYAEPWWGWVTLQQPFPYWSRTIDGNVAAIWSLPNPFVWWTGFMIFFGSLIYGWRHPTTRLLNVFLLTAWLPFAFISRIMYSYHAIPFVIFLALLVAEYLGQWWTTRRRWIIGYLVVAAMVFGWFLPWYIGWPLSPQQNHWRQWLPSWQKKTDPIIVPTTTLISPPPLAVMPPN